MRKLILLALGLGTLELIKRRSARTGTASAMILVGAAERGLNWLRAPGVTKRSDSDSKSD